jgi:copper(I)-binding protein
MLKKAFVFAACLLIASAAAAQQGTVEVTDAWRRATPGKAENGAASLTRASASTA